jgi:hypothetical protein
VKLGYDLVLVFVNSNAVVRCFWCDIEESHAQNIP